MGLIADAANRLKNVLGDLFPEEQPSATPAFPTNAPSPTSEPVITISKTSRLNPPTSNPKSQSTPYDKITSYNCN